MLHHLTVHNRLNDIPRQRAQSWQAAGFSSWRQWCRMTARRRGSGQIFRWASRPLATARSRTQSSDGTSPGNSHTTPESSKSVAWRKKETNEAANADAKTTRSWSSSRGHSGRSQVTTALLCQMSSSLGVRQMDFRHVGQGGALLVGLMVTFFSDPSGPSEGTSARCSSSLTLPCEEAGAVGWRDQQFACGSQRDVRDRRGELFGPLPLLSKSARRESVVGSRPPSSMQL